MLQICCGMRWKRKQMSNVAIKTVKQCLIFLEIYNKAIIEFDLIL